MSWGTRWSPTDSLKSLAVRSKKIKKRALLPNIILLVVSLSIVFIVAEVALRATGDVPGYLGRFINFKSVEKLEVSLPFVTDGEGVHKANIDHYNSSVVKINSEGFRGAEFTTDTSEKVSILFLGDSFAWGRARSR